MSEICLQRFRFAGRDVDSFVVPAAMLNVADKLCLPDIKDKPDAPTIGVILAQEKGYDGYVIDEPYVEALLAQNTNIRFLTYDNIAKQIQNLGVDGLLLIGGAFDSPAEYYLHPEDLPATHCVSKRSLAYLDAISTAKLLQLPVLGICAGFQMLAGYFGAKMYVNVVCDLNSSLPHKFEKRQDAHPVSIVKNSKLAAICDNCAEIQVNSIHSEGVAELSQDSPLIVSARSSDGNVEAVEVKGDWFALGVQWHPEYLWQRSLAAEKLFGALIAAARKYQKGE